MERLLISGENAEKEEEGEEKEVEEEREDWEHSITDLVNIIN